MVLLQEWEQEIVNGSLWDCVVEDDGSPGTCADFPVRPRRRLKLCDAKTASVVEQSAASETL